MQDDNDRRAGQERVPFEALVAVDGDAKAGGYECEAMDVSQTGMHLRTAYLPEIGQELMLRFDAGTGEVAVKGLVVWREEQARGGEFGLEFTALDDQSLASLRELCGLSDESDSADGGSGAEGEKAQTSRGSRVRLHIEGLGSPMRARVKDAEGSAVMVGSNLDFLRVGRELELENMDHGEKRAAFIDRVDVEIDPESKIPQLVVTLKYDAKEAGKGPAMRSSSANLAASRDGDASDPHGEEERAEDGDQDDGPGALDGLRGKASSIASAIGPAMSSFGLRAKAAMASAIATIKSRGQNTAEDEGEDGPKVTADAPNGGLSTGGRRAETLDESDELEGEEGDVRVDGAEEKAKKRKLLVAGGAAVAVLLALIITMSGGKKATPEAEAEAAAAASASAEMAALPAPGGGAMNTLTRPTLPPGADAVTAAVPLFGSTPLSTTEAAALPAPVASGGPSVAVPNTAVAAAAAPEAAEEKEPKDVGEATYGKGTVKNAKTVKLKMDAPIEGIKGAVAGKTLTITLPGRHNVEAASTLAKKDKRISSSKAVATSDGVDVSLTFKDNVPPFLAKTDGKTLAIELGESSGKGAVAENDDDDDAKPTKKKSKKHATAKKGDKDKHAKDKDKKKKAKKKAAHLVASPSQQRGRRAPERGRAVRAFRADGDRGQRW